MDAFGMIRNDIEVTGNWKRDFNFFFVGMEIFGMLKIISKVKCFKFQMGTRRSVFIERVSFIVGILVVKMLNFRQIVPKVNYMS